MLHQTNDVAAFLELKELLGENKAAEFFNLATSKGLSSAQATHTLRMLVERLKAPKTIDTGSGIDGITRLLRYTTQPVPIVEFIESPFYLNKRTDVYPAIMQELIEINSGKYEEVVLTGGVGPLSCDTEFLTPAGWVRMDSFIPGMEVAEYNVLTKQVEFRGPDKYEVRDCEWFYKFSSKYSVDMVLSPLHKVLYQNGRGSYGVLPAEEVARRCLENENGFCGSFITTFTPPDYLGISLTDAQIRLQVAVQADGSFDKRDTSTWCSVQVKKGRKKDRLCSLLKEAEVQIQMEFLEREGYVRFTFHAPLRSKDFEWAWKCSRNQLQIIVSELNHWDGSFSDGRYTTACKKSADFVQYAYSCCGLRSVISHRPQHSLLSANSKSIYRVGATKRNLPSLQRKVGGEAAQPLVTKVPSGDGKMYCFATHTGFFVARYNGKVFVTGNSGKTTAALYSQAYQLYLLSCLRDPHGLYDLDSSSEIKIIFQSLNLNLAKGVDFARFKDMIQMSPYFQRHFMFNKDINSKLIFPRRIEVEPVSGSETASIGQNVIGGLIDEINFMATVENSKSASDGGTYDQAIELYNTIVRRRKSRFMKNGSMPGLLCLVSSKRTPGQFTDKKEEEARTNPRIYVYDKRMWDIKPNNFGKERFKVFVGTASTNPRLIFDDSTITDSEVPYIDSIPMEFLQDFKDDITKALRDIAGKSTLAISPFMPNVEKVLKNFGARRSVCRQVRTDFLVDKLEILPSLIINKERQRFCHIDLSLRGDSTGVVIGHVPNFVSMDRGNGSVERLPLISIDLALEVVAPVGGEIEFSNVRRLLYKLRALGMPITWVTLDSYNSIDTMQILRSEGFKTGYASADIDTTAYQTLKRALYDGRVQMDYHPKLQGELITLEMDYKRNKVDHTATGSKDVADALALVVSGLTFRKSVWLDHGESPAGSPFIYNEMLKQKPEPVRPRAITLSGAA